MNYHYALLLLIISTILSGWFTWFLIKYLKKKKVLDNPEARSNHKIPTPRGGGAAMVLTFFTIYPLFSYFAFNEYYHSMIISLLVLAIGTLGFIDDLKSLKPLPRLVIQMVIVTAMVLLLFPHENLLLPSAISHFWDKLLVILCVSYFINIYNFMDGIDGITASNSIAMMAGVVAIIALNALGIESVVYVSAIVIGCAISFLLFNWHPAKIFYGDVGSLSLGLIVAYVLLKIAYEGYLAAALIIPGYYLFDATVTLLKRLFAGEKIWEAHSKHFYQLAARKGYKHSQVVIAISLINIALILIAVFVVPKSGAMLY